MANFPPPPVQSPFGDPKQPSGVSQPWLRWFQTLASTLSANGTITGSKGGNAALDSLLSNLNAKGIVSDKTT